MAIATTVSVRSLTLEEVARRCDAAARLTIKGADLIAEPASATSYASAFRTLGFTRLPGILSADAICELYEALLPILDRMAQPVSMAHQEITPRTLSDGHHLKRVDPRSLPADAERVEVKRVFAALGLDEFGRTLARRLDPLVQEIAGPVNYSTMFFNLYREGDYISVHNDHHMGERVNVQFPVTFGGVGALRVLENGYLRLHYDTPGAMTVLGPNVWHDVPPVMRTVSDRAPVRLTLTLRYLPASGG